MVQIIFHRFICLPLRIQLLFMAFLLSLPAIALIIYSGFEQRREALKEGTTAGIHLVSDIASEQRNLTGDMEQLLSVLALLPDIREKNIAATNALLADILRKNQVYGNIIVTDPDGNVWASAIPISKSVSVGDAVSFQRAVQTKHFSSGGYNIGRVSKIPTLGFCYPLLNSIGDVEGVVSVNFNFEKVKLLFEKTGLPVNSLLTITDYRGVIVSRNN